MRGASIATSVALCAIAPLYAALSEHIVSYQIDAKLDPAAKAVEGRELLVWLNDSDDEVRELWFHLYMNAFKNSKSSFMRESEGRRRGRRMRDGEWGWIDIKSMRVAGGQDLTRSIQFVQPDDGNPDDQTVIRVRLPQPVAAGESIQLQIDFYTKLPRVFARTGYHGDFFMVAQWFPKIGVYEKAGQRRATRGRWNCHQYHAQSEYYANYGRYLVRITVPSRFVVGATGALKQKTEDPEAGTTTYTFYQEDVHDFAWTASPHFLRIERDFIADSEVSSQQIAATAKLLDLPESRIRLKDVKMILLIQPEHRAQIERHFAALRAAIKYFGLWYGSYPYETITLVDPPYGAQAAGGMEYPTLITAGTRWLPSRHVAEPEGVIIHEFGHQYWYGLVANNEFEEAWLDEGFNTYSTGKILDKVYGPSATSLTLGPWEITPIYIGRIPLDWLWGFVRATEDADNKRRYLQGPKLDQIVRNAWEFYDGTSYVINSYPRSALVLRTLENILGEKTMAKIMRAYYERWRFRHPTTRDFIDVANEVSGQDLNWFFEQTLLSNGILDYKVDRISSREVGAEPGVYDKDGQKIVVTEEEARARRKGRKDKTYECEVTVRRLGEVILPVELLVTFESGEIERRTWDGRYSWAKFKFLKSSRIREAQVDPEQKLLLDVDRSNNSLRAKADHLASLGLTAKVIFWIQHLLQIIAAIA